MSGAPMVRAPRIHGRLRDVLTPEGGSVKHSHRHAMKRLAPATALIVATGLSAAGLASSSVAADASAPTLKLVAATKVQDVKRTKGEPVYLYDLGIHAVAE